MPYICLGLELLARTGGIFLLVVKAFALGEGGGRLDANNADSESDLDVGVSVVRRVCCTAYKERLDRKVLFDRTVVFVPRERAVVADLVVATDRATLLAAEALDLVDPTDRFDGELYFLGVLEIEDEPPRYMGFFCL